VKAVHLAFLVNSRCAGPWSNCHRNAGLNRKPGKPDANRTGNRESAKKPRTRFCRLRNVDGPQIARVQVLQFTSEFRLKLVDCQRSRSTKNILGALALTLVCSLYVDEACQKQYFKPLILTKSSPKILKPSSPRSKLFR
jgi:hypothetical protein